jgi:PhnB protein
MANVRAIPEGYSTLTPFLNVDGAAQAIEFYKKAFGAEERVRMPTPEGKIMHAELKVGDSMLMVSDAMRNPATASSLHIYVTDADAWWKRAVDAGAKVEMPIADMFWGDRYGVLSDRWGNRWAIAQHKEDVSPQDMGKRAAEAMKNL